MRLTTYRPYIVEFRFSNLDIDGRRPGEVLVEWLGENALGKYELVCCDGVLHFTQPEVGYGVDKDKVSNVNFLFFEKQKDAVLFKMKWGGV